MSRLLKDTIFDGNLAHIKCGNNYTIMYEERYNEEYAALQKILKESHISFQTRDGNLFFTVNFLMYDIESKQTNLVLKKATMETIYDNICNMHTTLRNNGCYIFDEVVYFVNSVSVNVSYRISITSININCVNHQYFIELNNAKSILKIHFDHYETIIESLKKHPETIFIVAFLSLYFDISIENLEGFVLELKGDKLKFQDMGNNKWKITNFTGSYEYTTFELLNSYCHVIGSM